MPMKTQHVCSEDELHSYIEENCGICAACGEWTEGGVEPDAEKYKCDMCGKMAVYGAEMALIMGLLDIRQRAKVEW